MIQFPKTSVHGVGVVGKGLTHTQFKTTGNPTTQSWSINPVNSIISLLMLFNGSIDTGQNVEC